MGPCACARLPTTMNFSIRASITLDARVSHRIRNGRELFESVLTERANEGFALLLYSWPEARAVSRTREDEEEFGNWVSRCIRSWVDKESVWWVVLHQSKAMSLNVIDVISFQKAIGAHYFYGCFLWRRKIRICKKSAVIFFVETSLLIIVRMQVID